MLKRVALAALIGVLALNVWTGSPMLALWIGSRVQGDGPTTTAAVFVVILAFAVFSLALVWALSRAGEAYDRHTGHVPTVRTHAPWLRSLRGEREQYPGVHARLSANERILVGMVIAAVVAFEIWFFFYSGSSIDQRTGR